MDAHPAMSLELWHVVALVILLLPHPFSSSLFLQLSLPHHLPSHCSLRNSTQTIMLISSDPTTATATTTTASHARCPPSPISPDPDSSTSPRSLSLPLSHSLLCSRSSSAFPPTPPDDDTHVSWDDTTPQPLLSPKPMHAVQQTPDGRETAGCEDASSASEASCASLSSSNGSSSSSPVDSDPEKRKIVLREGIEDWLRRCLANAC